MTKIPSEYINLEYSWYSRFWDGCTTFLALLGWGLLYLLVLSPIIALAVLPIALVFLVFKLL